MTQKRILIAEDEKPMANALSLKLGSAGYEITLVYDGEAAIAVLNESKYDLLILDLVMPKKDGFFVLAELKKLKIAVPIIVSSNLSQEEDIRRAKELGASDYFIKSDTTLAEIVEKVKLALGVQLTADN
ncbi:hypothetical protein A3D03_06720 [Candidatus Gottesmanbacteria bacterium RIFCSPHIGHO2_02_FULL_40_13]|uniref:Response regulatory domain-containing protein n=1 Tax=Candidatus Gottesmanbacteria bacterium RIFCSPHIGHO2_02_FULL_40_13 TaxID=1798384 RepID=A0A1F6ACB1_9BACT|nr:MAG: hypothetical protein A3D03_06720 [Candidatus Gottesmanbacteria bacterium RIFCSPHIGHO2_02_FULL_40_13]